MGCHFLLQRTFLTQGLNLRLQHCRQILYCLTYQGIHRIYNTYMFNIFKITIYNIYTLYRVSTECILYDTKCSRKPSIKSHIPQGYGTFLVAQRVKNPPAMWETQVWSLGREKPLEKGMASHPSILAWRIPWTEEPGKLQFTGSQRVGHNWASNTPQGYRYCPWLLIGPGSYQSIKFTTCVINVLSLTEFQILSTTKFNGKTCSVTSFYLLNKYS